MTKDVLIVCHAGASMGMGHLARMLALASVLQHQKKISLSFLVQGDPVEKRELNDFHHRFISQKAILQKEIESVISVQKPQIIVFDLHQSWVTTNFIKWMHGLRSLEIKIIGIENLNYADVCNILHVPTFWIAPEKIIQTPCPIFYGWDSFLLPAIESNKSWQDGNKIIFLTGGADVTGLSQRWPREIDSLLPQNIEVHWVQGPYAKPPILQKTPRLSWIIHNAPDGLNKLINKMNYAVTVFGVSLFELLQHGLPTVVFSPYGNKDNEELLKLDHENVCEVAWSSNDAVNKVNILQKSPERAQLISETAKNKMKVSGTKSLSRSIFRLLKK